MPIPPRSRTVCTLHATAFALLTTILYVAKLNSQFSVFTRLNCQLHLTHWTLSSLICFLSSILRFRGHCSVWVVLLTLFPGSLLVTLKLKQCAQFSRLFSLYGCCLGDLQIHVFKCFSALMCSEFLSAGEPALLKIGLVHLSPVYLTFPFGCLMGTWPFKKPNSIFLKHQPAPAKGFPIS